MATQNDDDLPVTHRLDAYTWSNEETAAYEAAIEAVNGAVGAYSALIAAERRRTRPDSAVIDDAHSAQTQLARERERLSSTDPEQIVWARAHYPQLAGEIRARTAP